MNGEDTRETAVALTGMIFHVGAAVAGYGIYRYATAKRKTTLGTVGAALGAVWLYRYVTKVLPELKRL